MKLNNEDNEEDVIVYYDIGPHCFHGVMLRMCPPDAVKSVPNDYLQKEKFLVTELDNVTSEKNNIRKSHYYFSLNDKFLVTTLPKNITISGFQTYINWILRDEIGDMAFQFTPMLVELEEELEDTKLYDLKSITIKDASLQKETSSKNKNSIGKKYFSVSPHLLDSIVDDPIMLEKMKENKIISAELLIKFSKPKKMSKEDYEKTMGAFLKPISDPEDFVFKTRKGNEISAEKLYKIKSVDIDLLGSGKISEKHLQHQMEIFLRELKNESSN